MAVTTAPPSTATLAVGIVRVSQIKGREGESFHTPETQRTRIRELAAAKGWSLLDLADCGDELNVSGGKSLRERPALLAAVEAIEAGHARVLVAAYLDRLTRDPGVRDEVVNRVEAAGGEVWAVDMGRQSNVAAADELTGGMASMVHRYVRRVAAERSREAQVRAVSQGRPPMVLPPGLLRVGDRIEPDLTVAPIVAEAVRLRADGAPIREVREYLAAHGVVRSHHGTQTLIASRLLVGEIVFGDLRGECPAIVARDVWEQAQRQRAPRGRRAKSDRVLARLGVLRCGTCGARMVVGSANRSSYFLYRCPPNGSCSRRVTIAAEAVEEAVTRATRDALDGCVSVRAVEDAHREARSALDRASDALDAAIRTLADFADEPATVARLRDLRQRRDDARQAVEELEPQRADAFVLLADEWDDLTVEDRRRCIRATFSEVVVAPAGGGRPSDRLTFVYHPIVERLRGETPPLPALVD